MRKRCRKEKRCRLIQFTNPRNMRNRFYRILDAIGLPHKGLHTFRHTFATRLINGVKQPDGSVKSLSVKQVAELLGHTTSEITELYYVKRDTTRLVGLTDSFNLWQNPLANNEGKEFSALLHRVSPCVRFVEESRVSTWLRIFARCRRFLSTSQFLRCHNKDYG